MLRFLPLLLLFAPALAQKPILVGYFGQWAAYNSPSYTVGTFAREGKAAQLDQLNYAQAFVTGGHCSVADPRIDLDRTFSAAESVNGTADDPASPFRGNLHQLTELKARQPHLRVFVSLEGRGSDFAADAQPEAREAFVRSCVDLFVRGHLAPGVEAPGLFDGIDLDWEYPQGPDAANFLALLGELRRQMDAVRPGLGLSIAVGPSPRMYEGSDFHQIAPLVDEVGLMTYDMAGPWQQHTGFIAPLYSVPSPAAPDAPAPSPTPAPTGSNPTASTTHAAAAATPPANPAPHAPPRGGVSGSVAAFLAAGVPASKLLVGVPFYGYGWTLVPEEGNGVYQEGRAVRGDRPYSTIQGYVAESTLFRDPDSQTPWLFDGDAFWTFDDPVSLRAKAAFAREAHLGGLMIWELSDDTPEGTLLRAAREGLSPAAVGRALLAAPGRAGKVQAGVLR